MMKPQKSHIEDCPLHPVPRGLSHTDQLLYKDDIINWWIKQVNKLAADNATERNKNRGQDK